jgi:F-type H+-transporting ATPase subunit gamma
MPPLREVRNRIKSVKNISQITRALEAVSASRVRRAQARALASRAFSEKAWEILINVQNASKGAAAHPLLLERPEVKNILVVLITSDRGLAGAYNTNILRVVDRFTERMNRQTSFVTIGRKGRDTMIRAGRKVVAEFSDLPPEPKITDISPIARLAIDAFMSGEVDEVLIAYTDFINMLTQRPVVAGWLPLSTHEEAKRVAGDYIKPTPHVTEGSINYEYEPDATAVLNEIVPRFTELQLYQALLESQASEHAARMAAMRNATDNATQLVADLTLEYNKARQSAITSEILDIVGGASALQAVLDAAAESLYQDMEAKAATIAAPVAIPVVAPVAVATAVAPEPAKPAKKAKAAGDDLTKIEGIGPKMSAALVAAGLDTFAKVAATDETTLRAAIEAAGMRLSPQLPTWPHQAQLAANGQWEELEQFQDNLGRRASSEGSEGDL